MIAADMQIFVHLLIVTSVLGFHKDFHKFILGGVVFMDFISCLRHLALDYELILFGRLKEVNRILGMFLLFGLGLTFLLSYHLRSGLVRFLRCLSRKSGNLIDVKSSSSVPFIDEIEDDSANDDGEEEEKECREEVTESRFLRCLSGKSGNSRIGFCSRNVIDGKSSSSALFIDEIEDDSDNDEEVTECDTTKLRKLLEIERQKVEDLRAELAEERAAAATAAEEAMAMILHLQREKSSLEMEWSQYRRLIEEKQIHDQQVIRSLQWLVWQHEFNRSLIEEEDDDDARPRPAKATHCRYKVKEEDCCFNGNILDALENVLYSSRDSDCFLSP